MTRGVCLIGLSVLAALAGAPAAAAAQVELRGVVALPLNNRQAAAWHQLFIPKLNEIGKGIVQVKLIGGDEVVPGSKAAAALQRGVFDVLQCPSGYYVGHVPEVYALMISTNSVDEIRANGGFETLAKIWNKRLNAEPIAWGETETRYNLYFTTRPKVTADGRLDLSGMKVRSTGTYRPIIEGLGGTPVAMPTSEVYTALQRGVVQGFGFPAVGVRALGVNPFIKYRIEPAFYRQTNLVLVNLDKWKALSKSAREKMVEAGKYYERESIKFMEEDAKAELADLAKYKVQTVTLKGDGAEHYLDKTREPLLVRLKKTSGDVLPELLDKLMKKK